MCACLGAQDDVDLCAHAGRMHVHMCKVPVHVCARVCVPVPVYACAGMYSGVHRHGVYTCAHVYMCMCVHVHVCTPCIPVCTLVHTHTSLCVCHACVHVRVRVLCAGIAVSEHWAGYLWNCLTEGSAPTFAELTPRQLGATLACRDPTGQRVPCGGDRTHVTEHPAGQPQGT